MAAKRLICKILKDRSVSMEEMFSTALAGAKEHHMSKASLSKLRSELAGHDVACYLADKKVEDIATELVKDAFSRLHHNAESNNGNEKEGEVQHDVHTTLRSDKETTCYYYYSHIFYKDCQIAEQLS